MSREDINKKLDELFEDKKARSFFNHLVKSYVPNTKVDKVFIKPKSGFKCVLTNDKLISVNEILEDVKTEEFRDDVFKYLHTMLNPEIEVEAPIKKLMAGRQIAIQGEKTDTFMSMECYTYFYDWVIGKFLKGDKHISWLMGDVNRKKFMKRAMKSNDPDVQNFVKAQEKEEMGNRATYSLGDMSVLQALKDKMEKN